MEPAAPTRGLRDSISALRTAAAARWRDYPKEVKASVAAWRSIVAIGRHVRRFGRDWDEAYSMALLADAGHALDWRFVTLLAARSLHRRQFAEGMAALDAEMVDWLAVTTARAGRIAESLRLAEHAGALNRFGHRPDQDVGAGLRAAIEGAPVLNLKMAGMRRPIVDTVLVDLAFATVARLRWLPGRIADEIFPLPFVLLEALLEDPDQTAGTGRSATPELSPYPLVRWWRGRRRRRSPDPDDGLLRLSFRPDSDDILFRASIGGRSAEGGIGPIVPKEGGRELLMVNASAVARAVFLFHQSSRTAPADSLELLRLGGLIVEAAIARLDPPALPDRLRIEATGIMGSLPWAALNFDGGYLVERFAIELADELDDEALPQREPRLTALAGSSPAMAREAALAHSVASDAGFAADPSGPLTRESLLQSLSRSTIVHLATHFRAHPHDSEAGEIQLADGSFLRIGEISHDLRGLELLFLSGCETGIALDDVNGGGETGAHPWRARGVRSVVSTLWRVEDEIGPQLAGQFYRRLLAGDSAASALAASQRQMRAKTRFRPPGGERFVTLGEERPGDDRDPAHPRLWGAYQLTGNGGPIRRTTSPRQRRTARTEQ